MAPDTLSHLQENTTGAAVPAATVREPAVLRGPHRPDLLRSETLPEILAATAARRPRHPALVWGDAVVTYGELDSTSNRLGAALRVRGAGPGLIVGLYKYKGQSRKVVMRVD